MAPDSALAQLADTAGFGAAPITMDTAPAPDPLEPVNRGLFTFNDRVYFWVLKPVAEAYSKVVATPVRGRLANVFDNLAAPRRFANCLLQADLAGSGVELSRFTINSTVGLLGLFDPAQHQLGLAARREDFGQTLGHWGVGSGVYLMLPFVGPSNLRDALGLVGDLVLDPLTYVDPSVLGQVLRGYRRLNDSSLRLGEYEQFKDAALDPYISLREAYQANRQQKIQQ